MWALPGPGIQPVSPALAGRFFTTEPPGKPSILFLNSGLQFGDMYVNLKPSKLTLLNFTLIYLNLVQGPVSPDGHTQQWKHQGPREPLERRTLFTL